MSDTLLLVRLREDLPVFSLSNLVGFRDREPETGDGAMRFCGVKSRQFQSLGFSHFVSWRAGSFSTGQDRAVFFFGFVLVSLGVSSVSTWRLLVEEKGNGHSCDDQKKGRDEKELVAKKKKARRVGEWQGAFKFCRRSGSWAMCR